MQAVDQIAPTPVPRVLVSASEGGGSPLLESLRAAGLVVLVSPQEALVQQVVSGAVDLVLLDTDTAVAFADLERIRQCSRLPVVVLVRDGRGDSAPFLEAGADDCVGHDVSRAELAARLRAVLRRRFRSRAERVLQSGAFELDPARHVFLHQGRPVHLPPKEFGLLDLLLRRDGRVVSRDEALELVWGAGRGGDPTTVDVHVKRLRAKLERDPSHPEHLLTVRGLGYRFVP